MRHREPVAVIQSIARCRVCLTPARLACAVLVLALAVAAPAQAANRDSAGRQGPIRFNVAPLVGRPRSHSPQTVDFILDSQLKQVIEGELSIEVFVGRRPVYEWNSGTLALPPGIQRVRTMLPAVTVHHEQTPVTVIGRFVGDRLDLMLGEIDLVVPAYWKRWSILGVVEPDERRVPREELSMRQALSLDRFDDKASGSYDVVTYPSAVRPENLPISAAGYAVFDVLLLRSEAFSQLRAPQLAAIAEWVEAGGSVCVSPGGLLSPAHVAFLNRMVGDAEGVLFLLDEGKRLQTPFAGSERPAKFHCGLGRAVILGAMPDPQEELESFREAAMSRHFDVSQAGGAPARLAIPADKTTWAEAALFLWKVRADQTARILNTGVWNFAHPRPVTADWRSPRPFGPQESPAETNPKKLLIPREVRGVPLWLVLTILGVFLVVIAPGDYYVLGALRLQRFTWLSLAFVSLAFTAGTMQLANAVMGNADYQTALTFVDLGVGDRPVRTSRYELHFAATEHLTETPMHNTLYARWLDRPSDVNMTDSLERYATRCYRAPISPEQEQTGNAGGREDLPTCVGRQPGNFVVRQQMRQWAPIVERRTTFDGQPAAPAISWSEFSPERWETAAGRAALVQSVLEIEPEARVLMFYGNRLWFADHNRTQLLPLDDRAPDRFSMYARQMAAAFAATPTSCALRFSHELLLTIVQASARYDEGLFTIVSQMAPTGADSFEDLSLVDLSNAAEWLLAVVVPRDTEILVFRKLYRAKL